MLEALADETDNRIRLNRRGYLYVTARPEGVAALRRAAAEAAGLGAGPLREHGPGSATYVPAAPAAAGAASPPAPT